MKSFSTFLLLICGLCGVGFAQDTNDNPNGAKIDTIQPSVYLRVERRDKERVWLRMYNNTKWAIAVRTFTFYFNRQHSITLDNGNSVFALPSDEAIGSLHYYVEKEPAAAKEIKAPELLHGDSYSISWIASKGSILFSVPIKQLEPGLMIYVPFQYEWELSRQLIFNKEPEHRVYFRGVDLTARKEEKRARS
jgi:hypothetical protein